MKASILERDNFSCQKCGFHNASGRQLLIHTFIPNSTSSADMATLCLVCGKFAPVGEKFKTYVAEAVPSELLETFRRYVGSAEKREAMEAQVKRGNYVSRPPLGYELQDKKLVPHPEKRELVRNLFIDCVNGLSLNKLARKYGYSVRGVKKMLMNKTYVGMLKFGGEWRFGDHEAIIDAELFENVQNQLKQLQKPFGSRR